MRGWPGRPAGALPSESRGRGGCAAPAPLRAERSPIDNLVRSTISARTRLSSLREARLCLTPVPREDATTPCSFTRGLSRAQPEAVQIYEKPRTASASAAPRVSACTVATFCAYTRGLGLRRRPSRLMTDCKHFRSFSGQHIRSCGKALRLRLGPRHHPAPKLLDCPPPPGRAGSQCLLCSQEACSRSDTALGDGLVAGDRERMGATSMGASTAAVFAFFSGRLFEVLGRDEEQGGRRQQSRPGSGRVRLTAS